MITDGGRMHIGSGTLLHRRCTLQAFGGEITIGDNSFIGEATIIVSALRISIGSDALIAENVSIRDQNHPLTSDNIPRRAKPTEAKEISIGRDVWISAGVIVTSGVTIGNGSVVGGGAVVTRNIPECSIATGVPARVRKNLG
ncbi:acyltransferase [Sphingomonas aurantiaca]|uniref:acyltransferase n=1 Tax=Sphingomonas aurantiaca TaxID=185949 RepID=UPI003A5BAB03